MKKEDLITEENRVLREYESGKLTSVKNMKEEKARYREAAQYTRRKSKNINIRLPERDLQHLKAIAAEKGLPYQTLISSLLHQYTAKRKVDV